jgi:hypothetical protein
MLDTRYKGHWYDAAKQQRHRPVVMRCTQLLKTTALD